MIAEDVEENLLYKSVNQYIKVIKREIKFKVKNNGIKRNIFQSSSECFLFFGKNFLGKPL
jgi:hypothetical protein